MESTVNKLHNLKMRLIDLERRAESTRNRRAAQMLLAEHSLLEQLLAEMN